MTENIGQQLRLAREARSISLEEVARVTHIRVHYLQAFEAGEFEALPSLVQGKGFLRTYASFLGIDPGPLVKELEIELGHTPTSNSTPAETAAASLPKRSSPSRAGRSSESTSPPAITSSRNLPYSLNRPTGPRPDTRAAQAIFKEIGEKLRRQRELLGLSLEDVERHTHLRIHYLSTLEAGDLEGLPSPVQGRGMLHNYASFLGMDPEPMMLRFAEGLQSLLAARQAVEKRQTQPRKPAGSSGRPSKPGAKTAAISSPADTVEANRPLPRHLTLRRFFTFDILLGVLIVIFLAGFMVWGGLRILNLRSISVNQTPTATAPSIADVLSTSSVITPTSAVAESTETISETLLNPVATLALPTLITSQAISPTLQVNGTQAATARATDAGPIQVNLVIRQRAWMRVLVDSKVEFDGIALPGSAYPFSGDKSVEVLTGNGAAIQVTYNQADQGVLGGYGEVIDRIYTMSGVVTPTASPTSKPQGTVAPLPTSVTPPASLTAQPSRTPTPKPTTRPTATPTP